MKRYLRLLLTVFLIACSAVIMSVTSSAAGSWVGAWSTAMTNVSMKDYGNISFQGSDITGRTVVTPTASGSKVRVKFSNLYGVQPITISSANIADSTCESLVPSECTSGIDVASVSPLTFGGKKQVTIRPGDEIYSDAITFKVTAMKNVAISYYAKGVTEIRTMGLSGGSTFVSTKGDKTSEENFNILNDPELKDVADLINRIPSLAEKFDISLSYSFIRVVPIISNLDVYASEGGYSIEILGDSTTANQFPLYLGQRISETGTTNVGIINKSIIGNTLAPNGDTSIASEIYGEAVLDRFDRDVKNQANVKYIIAKIGTNDIMHPVCNFISEGVVQPTSKQMISYFKDLCNKAHAMGAKIILSTITQWKGATRDYFGLGGSYIRTEAEQEADWKIAKDVNKWIKDSSNTYHDGYIDYAGISKSSIDADSMSPDYTSDYLHPNDNLQKIWANKVPLSLVGVSNKVGQIRLNYSSKSVDVGKSFTLKVASILPEDAKNKSYTWSSSDSSIASISSTGKVTAIKNGTVTISCKAVDGGGAKATCKVTVVTPVSSVTISQTSAKMYTRDTLTLKATVLPSTASNKKVTWTSSNKDIAKVSSKGVVTAVKSGTVTITAKTESGAKTATCKITVKKRVDVAAIVTGVSKKSMYVGKTYQIAAAVYPTDATYPSIKWSSSDTNIATVDKTGLVKAVKTGTCTVYAKSVDNPTVKTSVVINVYKHVSGITVTPKNKVLPVGQKITIVPTVSPSTAKDKTVTFKSSDKTVAKVSSSGVVTAVKPGSVEITVTTNDGGFTAKTSIQVIPVVKSTKVTLSAAKKSVQIGSTYTLYATITPSDTTDKSVSWISSDTKIATVSSKGVVKAKAKGVATITCVTKDTGKVAKCEINVVNVGATNVTLSKTSYTLAPSQTFTLKPIISPSNTTVKTVTWKSSNTSVATVNSKGVVKGVKAGTATITCTTLSNNRTATCKITVKNASVQSVKLSTTSISTTANKSITLKATVSPSYATDKRVIWLSSNPAVATVSTSGVIKTVAPGKTVITCQSVSGKKTATCTVTVNKISVSSIKLSYSSMSLEQGTSKTLKATVAPSNASNKGVTYKSSNTKVATVNSNGVVKAVGKGTATITCTAKDGSGKKATCKVTVNHTQVIGIKLNYANVTTDKGRTIQLRATCSPDTAQNKRVTWSSSNNNVATVSSNGVVTAVGTGICTITCKAVDGNAAATCRVIVNA